ncbi:MAG: hypothetical protein ACYCOR_06220 [Acidobacteriaceae bacterium]
MTDEKIVERLQKLEHDNRRLKAIALTALLLPGALLLLGGARATRTITANKFVLQDAQGQTRAVLQSSSIGTTLTYLDVTGRKRMVLAGGTGAGGNTYAYLELGEDATTEEPVLTTTNGHGGVTLSDGGLDMRAFPGSKKYGSVLLQGPSGRGGPAFELTDSAGYTTNVGVTDTLIPVTGQKQTTSAASIILFGKDRKVIWRAP